MGSLGPGTLGTLGSSEANFKKYIIDFRSDQTPVTFYNLRFQFKHFQSQPFIGPSYFLPNTQLFWRATLKIFKKIVTFETPMIRVQCKFFSVWPVKMSPIFATFVENCYHQRNSLNPCNFRENVISFFSKCLRWIQLHVANQPNCTCKIHSQTLMWNL